MAAPKRTSGARKAPARRSAPKPAAAKAPAAAAAPAVAPSRPGAGVELVSIAKGSRTFGSASGRRYHVVEGEHFTIDAGTAKLLLKTDPEAFVRADAATEAASSETSSGPITVEDLPDGAKVTKDEPETAATETAEPLADAATEAASSGEGDQGEAPASPETSSSDEAGKDDAPGAEVLT